MFEFIFGLVWTAFITPIFIICLVIPGEQRNGADMDLSLFLFLLIFEAIGLYILIKGIKKIITDWKTEKHGIECYGIVIDLQTTGSYVNNQPEYKAVLNFMNPVTNQLETIEEIVGFNYNKYPINSFILCKYYQGDINLENRISENEIPLNIKEFLVPNKELSNFHNWEFGDDKESVTIDGVKYKKVE